MNKHCAVDYKGKHFCIMDEGMAGEDDYILRYVDADMILNDEHLLREHVADCLHYGIPALVSKDEDLKTRVERITDEVIAEEKKYG